MPPCPVDLGWEWGEREDKLGDRERIEVLGRRAVRSGKVGGRGLWVALLPKLRGVWLIFERCMSVMAIRGGAGEGRLLEERRVLRGDEVSGLWQFVSG